MKFKKIANCEMIFIFNKWFKPNNEIHEVMDKRLTFHLIMDEDNNPFKKMYRYIPFDFLKEGIE